MKKAILILAAVLSSFAVRAETDYIALKVLDSIQKGENNKDQIKTLRVLDDAILPSGSIGTAEIADDAVTSAKVGLIAQSYTNTPAIDTTLYTPAFLGQVLVGTVSNTVHVSGGLTTNDWIQISN